MDTIKDGAKKLGSVCADCKHPKTRHMRATYHDEQRQTMSSTKTIDSECLECRKEGKKCERFRPSK